MKFQITLKVKSKRVIPKVFFIGNDNRAKFCGRNAWRSDIVALKLMNRFVINEDDHFEIVQVYKEPDPSSNDQKDPDIDPNFFRTKMEETIQRLTEINDQGIE